MASRPEMLVEGPTEEEMRIVGEHFAYHQDGIATGKVILVGRTQTSSPDTFGISIFNASSDEEAQEFAQNDPAVKFGVMTCDVFPYHIALFGPQNVA